jgi:CubicO group peptidase (beta-lactamase class C family)
MTLGAPMKISKAITALSAAVLAIWATASQPNSPAVRTTALPNISKATAVVDSVVTRAMAKDHLAGVTVSVVQHGKVILSKGYGYADLEKRIPVSPGKTIFHIGSVTKLFTATATMQLWEQNKLSLDQDVGRYLDFKWPRYSTKPITMASLMTHTAGFEESFLGFISKREDLRPLRDVVTLTIPNVSLVRDPGTARSYSNHGILLEGYVVERVAGMPFADYIESKIMKPLGMTRSSVHEPLPTNLRSDLSNGYSYADGHFNKLPDDYINHSPAGAISSTADDMARFMIAHLQNGRVDKATILHTETAKRMHSCQYIDHPLAYSCMGYGFFLDYIHGHPVIQHNGGTFNFLSNLVLLPEQDFGIFISVNAPDDGGLNAELPKKLIGALFGDRPLPVKTSTQPLMDKASDYEGYYAPMRRPYSGWLKLSGIGAARVQATGDHTLSIEGFDSQWYQVGPAIFRSHHPDASGISLAFKKDAKGRVVGASIGDGFDKVPAYATPSYALAVLGSFAVASLAFFGLVAVRRKLLVRRDGGIPAVIWPLATGSILFYTGVAIIAFYVFNDALVRGYAQPVGANIAVWCFNVMVLLFVLGGHSAFRKRKAAAFGRIDKFIIGAFLFSAVFLTLFLWYWDLIALHA